jgi:tetratricopeptide (TPR) repeat protein
MRGPFDKLAEIRPTLARGRQPVNREDEFLHADDLVPVRRQACENRQRMVLAELTEIFRDRQWQQGLDLFHPVEEKLPELVDLELDTRVREKLAFALGQLGRYDDAIAQLQVCVTKTPENFYPHSGLAYTAYNSLFAARNREIFLSGKVREERVALAHMHFKAAQRLRPDGVTNYYRQGMLFHKIEGKPLQALPLFAQAVANWETLPTPEKERRHQERKNYIKALYQKAGILLFKGDCRAAGQTLKCCLAEDEKSDHLFKVHKYFALGKIEYHANRLPEARDALLFAEKCRCKEPIDFVFELLARVFLGLESPDRALEAVRRVPEKYRRPYFRWTEADVLCALKQYDQAKAVLRACIESDRRSRHKGLIRLCKIEYLLGEYKNAMTHAHEADRFFRDKWINAFDDGLFWMALSAMRCSERATALDTAEELRRYRPGYPRLNRLFALLQNQGGDDGPTS